MAWWQLHLQTAKAEVDDLEDALLAAGASAITLRDAADQPLLEPGVGETPLWEQVIVQGLFAAPCDTQATLAATEQALGAPLPAHRWESLADQDWERAWMDQFQPLAMGERLWVVPSWHQPPQADAVNLRLDPGLAFGTGTHPTTALCLRWLDAQDLAGNTVLDYGCGSGILAIAALLLGAERAWAVDLDPQALQATRDNAARNGIDPARLAVTLPNALPQAQTFDVVLANILAGPLKQLAPNLSGHLAPGGRLCLSGILSEQAETVRAAYTAAVQLDPTTGDGDWVRLTGSRSNA